MLADVKKTRSCAVEMQQQKKPKVFMTRKCSQGFVSRTNREGGKRTLLNQIICTTLTTNLFSHLTQ